MVREGRPAFRILSLTGLADALELSASCSLGFVLQAGHQLNHFSSFQRIRHVGRDTLL